MKRVLLVFGIPLLAAALVYAMVSLRTPPPKKPPESPDPLVQVVELQTMTANFEVRTQGTVRPRTETVLSAEVAGTITRISPKFVAGGVFQRGEILLQIDPTNYKVAVEQADALVAQRQIEHDGANKLKAQGYRAEAEYASAKAALASARAELVRAKRNLERTRIRVPYEGIVRAKETDLGQFVAAGTRVGVVFATDFAEVRLPLTDQDLAFVDLPNATEISDSGSAGGPAVILSAVQKGEYTEWPAIVVRSEGVVDEKSRVTYAVARVDDPYRLHAAGTPLPVGTFVSAAIVGTSAENVIRVPREIVRGSDELVFLDDDNRLRIRSVKIVRADADHIYVGGGATAGERVVVTVLETPVNGMRVRTAADDTSDGRRIATTEAD